MAAPLQDNEKDALIARLQNENRSLIQEKSMLGLNYNHKKEDGIEARHLANNDIPVFTKVPELSTMKTDEDIDHLLIEGDNLPAPVALLPTYRGKVNVIYIDPPYNTGNNDFVYNDRYVDSEDGFRHSKWLSFMKPRLQLAHEMLSDDGVIFVSIDDHEQAYLKVMMDGIFGEDNFAANLIQDKGNAQNDASKVQKNHEYILVYTKSDKAIIRQRKKISLRVFKDDKGFYTKNGLTTGGAGGIINTRPRLGYTIYYHPKTGDIIPKQDQDLEKARYSNDESEVYSTDSELISQGFVPVRAPKKRGKLGCWTWSIEKMMNEKERLLVVKTKNGYSLYRKDYKNKENIIEHNGKYFYEAYKDVPSRSILSEFSTSAGTSSLASILSGDFSNPKNVEMLKYIISLHPSKNAIVLDFFAGSGTTGQAVAELNKEDGGHRKCILITNNFEQDGAPNGIARDITSVRMKRVLTGKEWADGKEHEPLPGNLIYYRLDWQPMSTSLANLPGMLPLSTFLGSLSINQDVHRLMPIPDNMPTLSKLVHDGHAALLTNENNRHTVLALDADTSDDFDTLDTVKAELEGSNLLEGLEVAMESGFDTNTYMDSGVFDHEFAFPVPDIIQIQATVKMLKKDGVISINDNQEDHTHMNNDGNEENR